MVHDRTAADPLVHFGRAVPTMPAVVKCSRLRTALAVDLIHNQHKSSQLCLSVVAFCKDGIRSTTRLATRWLTFRIFSLSFAQSRY